MKYLIATLAASSIFTPWILTKFMSIEIVGVILITITLTSAFCVIFSLVLSLFD